MHHNIVSFERNTMVRRFGILLAMLLLAACTPLAQRTATGLPTSATIPTTSPAGTAAPATSSSAPTAMPTTLDDEARLDAATPLARDQLALAEQFKGIGDVPAVARTTPLDVKVGDVETFWVSDNITNKPYQVQAQLRYAGPVALMYIDTQLTVPQSAIESSAKEFEQKIYPRDHELFGTERSPGVDGDPRITILTTDVRGAGGYFSSADSVVKAVNRFSNEREMFVIGAMPGTPAFNSTLAHEFQHMIEANEQQRSPSWFNEGLSTLAEDLNGYGDQNTALLAIQHPNVQLNAWSLDAAQTGEHYGTSQLFMRYFYEQYVQNGSMKDLIKADAGNNPEVFAQVAAKKRSDITSFADLVADWCVANLLNDPSIDGGRYAYKLLPATVKPEQAAQSGDGTLHQFAPRYLKLPNGPATFTFDGSDTVGLTSTRPHSGNYAWWSNRGDDSMMTLTRAFDLSSVRQATLQFATWYELEKDWDYGFVAVSTDGGTTWTTLKGTTTTTDDPQGHNYGNGLNGVSGAPGVETDSGTRGQWVDEQFDMSAYAGRKILLRFLVVNDDAYNAPGMLIDDIRIPELNYSDDVEQGDGGWEAQGFVRTTAELPQHWTVRLVRQGSAGTVVERVPVDGQGRATVQLNDGESGTLVIIPTTMHTTELAHFTYHTTS
jgi:immune inhibitor A